MPHARTPVVLLGGHSSQTGARLRRSVALERDHYICLPRTETPLAVMSVGDQAAGLVVGPRG